MSIFTVKALNYTIDKTPILKDISFSLEKGSLTLLCGQNGSGKSMLLKCLKGLLSPTSGSITVKEVQLKKKERMKQIGLVFQDAEIAIVGQTVEKDIAFGLENLNYESHVIEKKTNELLKQFSLEEIKTHHPFTLSGGEKRRLTLAGVLAMNIEVLLLDEPFANLDYPSTLLVLETLIKLKEEGHTLLVVSHEVEKLIALSDHLLIMNHGSIVYDGKPEEGLEDLKKNNIYVPSLPFKEMTWLA